MTAVRDRTALLCLVSMLGLLPFQVPATTAEPQVHVVETTADDGPGSLRAALEASARSPGPDRVVFGDRDGPFGTPRTIRLSRPLQPVTGRVQIDGFIQGLLWQAYGVTISGAGNHRLFEVAPGGVLNLRGITLADGAADNGGAVLNRGRLVLDSVTLIGNHADHAGGAVANDGGDLLFVNSTAADNSADRGGALAILSGEGRVTHATLYRNTATEGAALFNAGSLNIANSILAGGNAVECVNNGRLDRASTHNLMTSQSGCGTPLLTADPRIEDFGHYNGPTPVFVFGSDSPAMNLALREAAVGVDGEPLQWDQRGNGDPRFAGGFADLGAYEQQGRLPEELMVDTLLDTGLRGCARGAKNDCPLRAALELAAASRHPVPVVFDREVFSMPSRLQLDAIPPGTDTALVIDGAGTAGITIIVPRARPMWVNRNGVELEVDEGLAARGRQHHGR